MVNKTDQEIRHNRKVKCVTCLNEIKAIDSFVEEDGSCYCEICYDEYLDKIYEEERLGL